MVPCQPLSSTQKRPTGVNRRTSTSAVRLLVSMKVRLTHAVVRPSSGRTSGHASSAAPSSGVAGGPVTEVFSTDWPLGGGQDEGRGDDRTDALGTQADAPQRFPSGLEQGDTALAFGAQSSQQPVAAGGARSQVAALGRGLDADTRAVVPLVSQGD